MLLKQLVQDFTLDFDDKTATGEWGGGGGGGEQRLGVGGFQHGEEANWGWWRGWGGSNMGRGAEQWNKERHGVEVWSSGLE